MLCHNADLSSSLDLRIRKHFTVCSPHLEGPREPVAQPTPTNPAHFFLPFALFLDDAAAELVDTTLDARDGAAELALLPLADLTLSRALF
jgi:hypothetical protein